VRICVRCDMDVVCDGHADWISGLCPYAHWFISRLRSLKISAAGG
jgi:hypothetical protein